MYVPCDAIRSICVDSDSENPFNDNSLDDIDVQNNENSRPSHDTFKVSTTRFLCVIPFSKMEFLHELADGAPRNLPYVFGFSIFYFLFEKFQIFNRL